MYDEKRPSALPTALESYVNMIMLVVLYAAHRAGPCVTFKCCSCRFAIINRIAIQSQSIGN